MSKLFLLIFFVSTLKAIFRGSFILGKCLDTVHKLNNFTFTEMYDLGNSKKILQLHVRFQLPVIIANQHVTMVITTDHQSLVKLNRTSMDDKCLLTNWKTDATHHHQTGTG